MPESLGKCAKKLDPTSIYFYCDSYGLHDLQFVLRYQVLNYIGVGGLDSDDTIQLLHTMYAVYIENRSYWYGIIHLIVVKLGYNSDNLPKKLDSSMQAPPVTMWWSISVLSSAFSNFYKVYVEGCQACINSTKTTEKINVIVSNLLQMFKVLWIVAGIHFLSAVSDR